MPRKILILENSPEFQQLLGRVVASMGHEACLAERATDAWKMLQGGPVALVLLDIKLPLVHGEEFLKYIRAHGCQAPVIAISGYLTPKVLEQLKRYGVRKVIAKPFKVRRLAADIDEVLGGRDA